MNDLDLCLEVISRSCQPLRYIRRWISRKPLELWFQRTTNRKWPSENQTVAWPMTSRDPKIVTPIRLERNISKTAGDIGLSSKGPPIGNGLLSIKWCGHISDDVTWKVVWGNTVGYPSDSLAYCLNLIPNYRCQYSVYKKLVWFSSVYVPLLNSIYYINTEYPTDLPRTFLPRAATQVVCLSACP